MGVRKHDISIIQMKDSRERIIYTILCRLDITEEYIKHH